ncbi:MAG: helix-turn-helix transcriptional regulator [Bacteroidales bacterium]|nr:helix-turn-helix transcriptional regulator [Bacteroidales bacterium]
MKTIDVLRQHESVNPSKWREEAEYRRKNDGWLRYSQSIALTARQKMADTGLTQTELAKRLECTQQHVSLILKGNSNLTLETVYKLEKALDISILRDVTTIVDAHADSILKPQRMYLSEADSPGYGKTQKDM